MFLTNTKHQLKIQMFAGLTVSGVFLWWLFQRFDHHDLWQTLVSLNPYFLGLAVIAYSLSFVVRTLRWQVILGGRTIPAPAILKALLVGCCINGTLPCRLGEIGRAWYLGKKAALDTGLVIGNIALERILEALCCLAAFLVLVNLYVIPDPYTGLRTGMWALLGLGCLGIAIAFRCSRYLPGFLDRFAHRTGSRWAAALLKFSGQFFAGVQRGDSPGKLLVFGFASVIAIGLESLTYYLILKAMQLDLPFPLAALCFVAVMLSAIIPAAPGNAGLMQYVPFFILTRLQVPETTALNFAVIITLFLYAAVFAGLLIILFEKNLAGLRQALAVATTSPARR
ncbi:MAG: lysylphosphatidylglycerol synthase transmembrane domain-containing protein [Heliobacteriaceae bacterium]|nr:lysylphosphatidylglycerol synthase transmembrane domain-containing protein [Heliobacteriaceae bacterium]